MNQLIFSDSVLPLIAAMAIEGGSVPFPGILVALAFGSTFRPSFFETMLIASFMATTYTTTSFIPYMIGRKFGVRVLAIFDKRKKVKASIEKSKELVKKYGILTIAISRFLAWGNKISYIAGISKISYLSYGILTFSGRYIWALMMLNLGKVFKGNTNQVISVLEKYMIYIYLLIGLIAFIYIVVSFIRYKISTRDGGL